MPRTSFVTGIDGLMDSWLTDTFQAMLLTSGWVPNPMTNVFVNDIVGFESAAGGYARQTIGGKTRTSDLPVTATGAGFVTFGCDDIDFGVLTGGTVAAFLAVYQFVTDDLDSPLVCAYSIFYTADGVTPATIEVSANGLVRFSTLCSADFEGHAEGS